MKLWSKLVLRDLALVIACILAFVATCTQATRNRAEAHNPDTHEEDELSNATSDAYGRCCVGDEYTKLNIEEWEPTATGWRIKWHGQWLEVPRRARVNNMQNPDGIAKAWVFGEPDAMYVRCFMPGAMG